MIYPSEAREEVRAVVDDAAEHADGWEELLRLMEERVDVYVRRMTLALQVGHLSRALDALEDGDAELRPTTWAPMRKRATREIATARECLEAAYRMERGRLERARQQENE